MDLGQEAIGGRGNDGKGLDRFPIGGLPGVEDAGKGKQRLVLPPDVVGNFACRLFLPFKESRSRNQTPVASCKSGDLGVPIKCPPAVGKDAADQQGENVQNWTNGDPALPEQSAGAKTGSGQAERGCPYLQMRTKQREGVGNPHTAYPGLEWFMNASFNHTSHICDLGGLPPLRDEPEQT